MYITSLLTTCIMLILTTNALSIVYSYKIHACISAICISKLIYQSSSSRLIIIICVLICYIDKLVMICTHMLHVHNYELVEADIKYKPIDIFINDTLRFPSVHVENFWSKLHPLPWIFLHYHNCIGHNHGENFLFSCRSCQTGAPISNN